jgi:uncharacterized membrane protein
MKIILIVVAVASYALLSHFALILPSGRHIAAALALAIPVLAGTWFIYQLAMKGMARVSASKLHAVLTSAVVGLLALCAMLLVLAWAWPWILANTDHLYFVQHVGTNALLAWGFGHTLVGERTPLVVTFARIVHPNLPPEIAAFARKVTLAWTLFFLATCAISALLFFAAPISWWSTFAVLLQWPTVALFFVGEYVLRKRKFRNFEHASMKQGFDAYRQNQQMQQQGAVQPLPKV